MSKEIKRIDIKEFREKGFLQEVNRQFLHPMGLALEVVKDENGDEKIGGIWDYRNDPEGIIFDLENSDSDRIEKFRTNAKHVDEHIQDMIKTRIDTLGFGVESIPDTQILFEKYSHLIDHKNMSLLDKSNNQRTKHFFNKLINPIELSDGSFARVYQDSTNNFTLIHIHENEIFSTTYGKDSFKIENNKLIKII